MMVSPAACGPRRDTVVQHQVDEGQVVQLARTARCSGGRQGPLAGRDPVPSKKSSRTSLSLNGLSHIIYIYIH